MRASQSHRQGDGIQEVIKGKPDHFLPSLSTVSRCLVTAKNVPNHQREQTMMRAINLFRLTEFFTIWLQVEELNIFSCN